MCLRLGEVKHAGAGGCLGCRGLRQGELRLGDLRGSYLHGAQAFEVCQAFEKAGEGCGGVFLHSLPMATGGDGKNVVLRWCERYNFCAVHGVNINAAL